MMTILFIASTRMSSWTVSCVGDHNGGLGGMLRYPSFSCITNVFKHRSELEAHFPIHSQCWASTTMGVELPPALWCLSRDPATPDWRTCTLLITC
ncbi:hypothetical protein F4604DRAFT_186502 [Suillus subluteus]|nr:hypothetical protein F4604DRAFT_186502 [Suillus subluteus]